MISSIIYVPEKTNPLIEPGNNSITMDIKTPTDKVPMTTVEKTHFRERLR